jgi:dienelactone hydrolase
VSSPRICSSPRPPAMRPFEELSTLFACLATACLLALGSRWRWAFASSYAALCAFVLAHLVSEGVHWQLAPLYLVVALLPILRRYTPPAAWRMRAAVVCCVVLILVSFALCNLLPMFALPQPTGAYRTGTEVLYMVDTSRHEIHVTASDAVRELMVQVWYPADSKKGGHLAPYRRWSETTWLSSYMSVLKTHSRIGVPVASEGAPFPVLLFNPAWGNQRTQNTYEFEDLASHGFVVVAVDHTYNSRPVSFPDGRRIAAKDLFDIEDLGSFSLEELLGKGNREADYQAQDDSFVLDSLRLLDQNPGSIFAGKLATDRAGAFGHSFGGAVAMQACYRDKRIRAAINMDGWLFGDVAHEGLNKPLLVMGHDDSLPRTQAPNPITKQDDELLLAMFQRYGGALVTIHHSQHMNFSDRSLYSPVRKLAESGTISPQLAHQIVESYTLAFFSTVLKGTSEPLLSQQPSPFPEASYQTWPPGPIARGQ